MYFFLIAGFLSAYQAWPNEERPCLNAAHLHYDINTPALEPLVFSTKLNLSQELELGKDMYWSDTMGSTKRSGFDLTRGFPIPPKTYSWSTGKEENTVFYTLSLNVHIELASMNYTLGLVGCESYGECDYFVFGNIVNNWNISSPASKEGREWEIILSKVIPHTYFTKKQSPPFPVEKRLGLWSITFRQMHMVISGTLDELRSIDYPSSIPFAAYFPLHEGNRLIGIIGMEDFCKKGLPIVDPIQKKLLGRCETHIFYPNY